MTNIVRVDGWPCAPGTAAAFTGRLKPAFERAFPGVTLHVYSGYRSYDDQVKIFTERYRRNGHSPYGDYRYWDGSTWGRVSGAGTVAAPGTSNHQSGHALDIRDSGSDAGVTIAGNARSNWIRANASRYGFTPIGYTFGEPWHIEYTGTPWTGGGPSTGGGGIVADIGGNMEAYLLHENGNVFYVRPGLKKKFTSVDDYNAWRETVNGLRRKKQTSMMRVPYITGLKKLSGWRFDAIVDGVV